MQIMTNYEEALKYALHLSHTERLDAIYDILTNLAILSGTQWATSELKQEALEEIYRMIKDAQCLC